MATYKLEGGRGRETTVRVPMRGSALLDRAIYNKGTAFTHAERDTFGLTGLLPTQVDSIEQQARRDFAGVMRKPDDLERYIGLAAIHDRNEILFYYMLLQHIEELAPIVYTPTVGLACQRFSHIFRRGRGLWITPEMTGRIHDVLANAPFDDVRLIVVTDNERILGLGDQGAGGMGIPVGKLALYTLGAGIHPTRCLPISLDVGTDNQSLLDDPLYLGYHAPRLRGQPYYDFLEEFVEAVHDHFPHVLLQWEDFKKQNAFTLLDRYADRLLSFNDDIQGTAAVALAGVMAGNRIAGRTMKDHHVVILGAGAAGIGIARQLRAAFGRAGLSASELTASIALLDSHGLLVDDREIAEVYKRDFAWPAGLAAEHGLADPAQRDLATVIDRLKATVLIGTSGQRGAFTEEVVRAMARQSDRPMIFPYSNPTSKCEATPADILAWSDGRALVATGSPFDPVTHDGRVHRIGQGNNVYIFPGVGLGAMVAGATRITDAMFAVAAHSLAGAVQEHDLAEGALYPRLNDLRSLTAKIALAVAHEARDSGHAPNTPDETLDRRLRDTIWDPKYPDRYVPA